MPHRWSLPAEALMNAAELILRVFTVTPRRPIRRRPSFFVFRSTPVFTVMLFRECWRRRYRRCPRCLKSRQRFAAALLPATFTPRDAVYAERANRLSFSNFAPTANITLRREPFITLRYASGRRRISAALVLYIRMSEFLPCLPLSQVF